MGALGLELSNETIKVFKKIIRIKIPRY